MAQDNIIGWNAVNWVTVVLMVAIGLSILGFGLKWIKGRQQTAAKTPVSVMQ